MLRKFQNYSLLNELVFIYVYRKNEAILVHSIPFSSIKFLEHEYKDLKYICVQSTLFLYFWLVGCNNVLKILGLNYCNYTHLVRLINDKIGMKVKYIYNTLLNIKLREIVKNLIAYLKLEEYQFRFDFKNIRGFLCILSSCVQMF